MPQPQDHPPERAESTISNDAPNQGVQGMFHAPVTNNTTIIQVPAPPAPAATPHTLTPAKRTMLLALLAERYAERIQGNLAYAVRLQLGLHTRPAAVDPAWRKLHLRGPLLPSQPVPPETPPLELFEQQKRQLLVLGAPGAGKTTLLVELAQALTARAQADPAQPIPVVLNLASWQTTQTIRTWLEKALHEFMGGSKRFAKQLAESQELLLLLDGLDEVAEERRAACVAAINAYLETVDIGPQVVVGCRSTEYASLGVKLAMDGAVELEPLDLPAIEQALADVPAAHGVLLALQTDELLRELARTPLMVNVLLLTYAGQDIPAVQASSIEERRTALWTAYLRRMVVQRPLPDRWSPEQALRSLVWLAGLLRAQSETNFLLDDLQQDVLPSKKARSWYRWLLRLEGMSIGILAGFIISGVVGGVIFGILFGYDWGVAFSLIIGLASIMFGGLIGISFIDTDKITRYEYVNWSWFCFWEHIRKYWIFILIISVLSGLIGEIVYVFFKDVSWRLSGGLFGGLVIMLIVGLYGGWQVRDLNERIKPLDGIRSSLTMSFKRSIVYGLSFGLLFFIGGLFTRDISIAMSGLMLGATLGILGGCLTGGLRTFIQHHTLRFVLARMRLLPFETVAFLDALCDRLLLERDGAIYRFRHILLRDFCADLSDAQLAELAREADR